ncbi:DUF1385 domain-containing protein [Gordonibacter massiliensis (ex Traore et al. 2017)]|uniref:DUF1385 domain-containing protein n=1 Tax=Gordonibacter massiliensis (ex Traore et al. 2017) TaxID=1841863 RepID=A0A842JEC8_9ACTN|nr:DUF1385 domain-containing protein [Gordonibacter massiliensis (ex Traore et al. 2017)]MBC2888841.1 DUF1385 domain-containing protein [Gordonibacter massiliensis (ex Traore et al. 2017)]
MGENGATTEHGGAEKAATERSAKPKKSDLSRAFSEDGARKTHVGGQALIEGIMMRGKYNWSVAVREPAGDIYVEEHDLASGRKKNGWLHWPLVRGCRALVESLVLGFKALEIAAEHAFAEDEATGEGAEGAGGACGSGSPARTDGPLDRPARAELASDPSRPLRSEGDASSGDAAVLEDAEEGAGDSLADEKKFSWKDDFGRPETMIDALGAQASLEVVCDPTGDASAGAGCCPHGADGAEADASRGERTDGASAGHPEFAAQREAEGPSAAAAVEPEPEKKSFLDQEAEFGKGAMAVSMVFGLVLGVVLFIVAPAFVTNLVVGEYDQNTVLWNVVDGLLRVAVFVFYLWLIGRMAEIKRMFGYHGAEHKTIHCYEHGLPLTPENARSFPRLHVRCGTAFLIMVMIIAILVYTVTPINGLIAAWGVPDGAPKLALVILVRILLMPVIAGISYEITVRWAGSHPDNPLVKVVLWPGMQMQYLTTNEPDDGQIECAIAAMQRVLEREEAEAAKAAGSNVGTAEGEGAASAAA